MIGSHTGQVAVSTVVSAFPLARSSYYYQPRLGQRGRPASQQTMTQAGLIVTNEQVVEWIHELFQHPFICYGYEKVTDWLRQSKGLIINKKKRGRPCGISADETSALTLA